MTEKLPYLKPLGTLQIIAIVTIVLGHFWIKDSIFLINSCANFCFAYCGFFTARRNRFDSTYGLKDHLHFLWTKLAKIYPVYVLALALCIYSGFQMGDIQTLNLKIVAAHLTLLSPWIPYAGYYFGYNAVAWFFCALFFLYILAPVVVRFWRRIPLMWQLVLLAILRVLEFIGGFTHDIPSGGIWFNAYHLNKFPPLRLLDFSAGIILYNLSQSAWWNRHKARLTPSRATLIEAGAIVLTIALYPLCKKYLHAYCYRAFCSSFPMVTTMLCAFLFTSGKDGAISRALSVKPLTTLAAVSAEVYLLQLGVHFTLKPLFVLCGIAQYPVLNCVIHLAALFAVSWLVHRYYTVPLARLLTPDNKGHNNAK